MATKAKTTKKVAKKQPLVVSDKRIFRWVASTLVVGGLGLSYNVALIYIAASTNLFNGEVSPWFVTALVISLYLIFLVGFIILGKFWTWRVVLAVGSLMLAMSALVYGTTGVIDSLLTNTLIAVGQNVWITPSTFIYFSAYFLVVASGAAILQGLVLHRQKHAKSAIIALIAIFVVSALVIFL